MSLGTLQRNKGRAKVRGIGISRSVVTGVNPVEVETIYFEHDFEDGTLGPFFTDVGASGTVSVSTAQAHSGTKSVLCRLTAGSPAKLAFSFNTKNPVLEPTGVYIRWWQYISTTTQDNADAGQIKFGLQRYNVSAPDDAQGWLMLGIGAEFGVSKGTEKIFIDPGIINFADNTFTYSADTWIETQIWLKKSVGVDDGEAKIWVNGSLLASVSHTNLGKNSDTNDKLRVSFGISHTQAASYPLEVFIDDVKGSDTFIT